MSTRSYIGRLLDDGRVEYIYCHFDGYVEGVGATLYDYHNTEDEAKEIISFGSASSIEKNTNPPENVYHDFDNKADGISVYYHRDRGEDWEDTKPRYFDSEKSYWNDSDIFIEYYYLFKDGKWFVRGNNISVSTVQEELGY